MTIFIKRNQSSIYLAFTSSISETGWTMPEMFTPLLHPEIEPLLETDFTNGSEFYEAERPEDLNWCDAFMQQTLEAGYIDKQGQYYGVQTHLRFSHYVANKEEVELEMSDKWVKIARSSQKNWQHISQVFGSVSADISAFERLTKQQEQTIEKLGFNPDNPEQDTRENYCSIFGNEDTKGMRELRADVEKRTEGRFQILKPEVAKNRIFQCQYT